MVTEFLTRREQFICYLFASAGKLLWGPQNSLFLGRLHADKLAII